MFEKEDQELVALGAINTVKEIKQQPHLWQEAFNYYHDNQEKIKVFLEKIIAKHGRVRVIFTGAGTSAYVGDVILPYLKQVLDESIFDLHSIPTTSIVSNPAEYLKSEIPTLLVSFARSGNSPESVATVNLADQCVKYIYHLTITCASDGALAKNAKDNANNLLLLMPSKSNDLGFAMTSSFSCMLLTGLLVFDPLNLDLKNQIVKKIQAMGQVVITQEKAIQALVDTNFQRLIYLGSGCLSGLTREAQLKILELTAGKITTVFDSSLGFRHGPKSFVNTETAVLVFVSNQPYSRKYDIDIIEELKNDNIASVIYPIAVEHDQGISEHGMYFNSENRMLPDAYLALPYIMIAQILALLTSLRVGNTPDTPSPSGTVNRVVKGVKIYPFEI